MIHLDQSMVNNASPRTDLTLWIGGSRRPTAAQVLVYCLPYSGAGAGVFQHWSQTLPPEVAAIALRLPGREQRIGEPHHLDPEPIATAIATSADRPYAIYGHSLGARLGFDVLRVLRRQGVAPPMRFYPAAARPPDVIDPLAAEVADLPDEQFIAVLIDRLSASAELRDEPELRELLLPTLRADLEWIHRYQYRWEPPVPVPIVAIAGAADREVGPADMQGWAAHTSSSCQVRSIPGDHFFLRGADVTALLAADLLGDIR